MIGLREMSAADGAAALALLCEGFPARSPAYWRRALGALARQERVAGLPGAGLLLEDGAQPVGIMLLPRAAGESGPRINLSSWYIRPAYRSQAMRMMQGLLRLPGVTLLNLTPAPHVRRLMLAMGFQPYSTGQLVLSPLDAWRGGGRVGAGAPEGAGECGALLLRDAAGEMPALYRRRWLKRGIPAAQFVAGEPARLAAAAGPLMRALLPRGFALGLMDWGAAPAPAAGRLFLGREVRLARGPAPPVGELRGTELSLFGP